MRHDMRHNRHANKGSFLQHFQTAVILALTVLLCGATLSAQFTTASLGGTVTDATGASMPEAQVTAKNTDTGLVFNVTTTSTGAYLFSRLPVGSYELTVQKDGFSNYVQTGITLTVNLAATQNVTMQVGAVTESVSVLGDVELITSRTATAGQVVGQKPIIELPLNGRRPERLIYLTAGTLDLGRDRCRICGHGGVYPGEETAGVNGAGIGQVNFQLDATSNNDTYINISLPFPNPDAVQEFNVQTSNFTAEYGNASGAIVNIVTKSGTNSLHGSLFHFLRNGSLNSRQFFGTEQDKLKRNQFGGSIGGPIIKDKMFFFGTYQGTRLRDEPSGIVSFVPTADQRTGDFSNLLPDVQLVDPVTGADIVGNMITSINPVSQFFLDRIPLPDDNATGRVTFAGSKKVETENQFLTKVDFTSGKHTVTGRYFFTDFDAPPEVVTDNILAATSAGNAVRVQNFSLNHTYTASPTLLINSTFGLNRQRGGSLSSAPFSLADAGAAIIGPESSSLASPPELVITVTDGFRIRTNHLGDFDRGDFTVREVVTKIAGAHELRFGGEAVRVTNHIINTFQMASQVSFSGELSGNGLADFMLGRSSRFRQGGGEFKDLRGTRWGFFVQDNWRATPRLSVNLGVRWDPYIPYYDREGRVVCFQPGTTTASQQFPGAPLGFLFGGDNADPGCPKAGSDNDWANIGPRVGLAYRLTDDGKTTLRGGFGVYYTPIQTSNMNPFTNIAPFAGTFTLNDVAFEDPYDTAGGGSNPFPNNFGPEIPPSNFVFEPRNDIRAYFALDFQIPQLNTWNVRLERQIGNDWVGSIAYLGNKATFLPVTTDENAANFIPGVDGAGDPLSTVGNTDDRRPISNFLRVRRQDAAANSSYHALQFNLQKRFASGYSILTNYTWSRTIDDKDASNPFNRRGSRGLAREDVEHNFKFSNIYNLPRLDLTGAASKILNGWQVNSIVTWQSGFPFTVGSGRDNSFSGVRGDRADTLGNATLSSDRPRAEQLLEWFDTSMFVPNARGTFGNAGRNILRGPKFFNADMSLLKTTNITEQVDVQFRAEFFNIVNSANFRLPNSNQSSSQFGLVTAVVAGSQSLGSQRVIQFGLKILF